MSFDWQTDESWGETVTEQAPEQTSNRWWRRWWWLILGSVLITSLGGWWVWSRLTAQVDDAVTDEESQLVSSVELVRQAAQRDDSELLVTTLSGRDPTWAELQQLLLINDVLFERTKLGLTWSAGNSEIISVTLSPNLSAADVLVVEEYMVDVGNGVTESVQLLREEVYRRGDERWLLAPPVDEDEALLPAISRTNDILTLNFPEAESEIGEKLWRDLNQKSDDFCRLPDIVCPDSLHVKAILTGQLGALQMPTVVDWLNESTLILPSPMIVGLPADEVSYQALLRGYAGIIFNNLLAQNIQYECCVGYPFYQAMADRVLRQIALKPSPLTSAHYFSLLNNASSFRTPQFLLDEDNLFEQNIEAEVIVAFLGYVAPQKSAGALLNELWQEDSYLSWLYQTVPDVNGLDQAWLRFLAQEGMAGVQSPPVPFPQQDLMAICSDDRGEALVSYQPTSGFWQTLERFDGTVRMFSLGENAGILLSIRPANGQPTQLRLYRSNGEVVPVDLPAELTGNSLLRLIAGNSANQIFIYNPQGQTDYSAQLDLSTCTIDNCQAQPMPFSVPPVFAPDNKHALWQDATGSTLWDNMPDPIHLLDENLDSTAVVGQGIQPLIWFSADSYAYRANRAEFVEATIAGDTKTLFTTDFLLASLSEPISGTVTTLTALPNPYQPDQLFINLHVFLSNESENRYFLMLYDRRQNSAKFLHQSDMLMNMIRFSADGEWLGISAFSEVSIRRAMILLNLRTGEGREYQTTGLNNDVAWSADGAWLAHANAYFISLHLPAFNHQQLIIPNFDECRQVGWR